MYAENELGIHEVYEAADEWAHNLTTASTRLTAKRSEKRSLEERIAQREMEVAEEEWSKHPDMAVTRMEKHLRSTFVKDAVMHDLRNDLNEAQYAIDLLEVDKATAQSLLSVHTARMIELGGYFNYLAAIKQAELHEKPKPAGDKL